MVEIQQRINQGISNIKITDIHEATEDIISNRLNELLRPLVTDNELRNLLTLEENMQRIRSRIECNIKVTNGQGTNLADINHIGQKTPRTAIEEIRRTIKKGQDISEFSPTITKTLENMNYSYAQHISNGRVGRVDLNIVFRKG